MNISTELDIRNSIIKSFGILVFGVTPEKLKSKKEIWLTLRLVAKKFNQDYSNTQIIYNLYSIKINGKLFSYSNYFYRVETISRWNNNFPSENMCSTCGESVAVDDYKKHLETCCSRVCVSCKNPEILHLWVSHTTESDIEIEVPSSFSELEISGGSYIEESDSENSSNESSDNELTFSSEFLRTKYGDGKRVVIKRTCPVEIFESEFKSKNSEFLRGTHHEGVFVF